MISGRHHDIAMFLDGAGDAVPDVEIEQRRRRLIQIGVVIAGVVIDPGAQLVAPLAFIRGDEVECVGGQCAVVFIAGVVPEQPHDLGRSATVEKEVTHREAEVATLPQTAELPLEVAETGDGDRLGGAAPLGASHECGDGRRHSGDGAHPAGNLLHVDPGVTQLNRHGRRLSSGLCSGFGGDVSVRHAVVTTARPALRGLSRPATGVTTRRVRCGVGRVPTTPLAGRRW